MKKLSKRMALLSEKIEDRVYQAKEALNLGEVAKPIEPNKIL